MNRKKIRVLIIFICLNVNIQSPTVQRELSVHLWIKPNQCLSIVCILNFINFLSTSLYITITLSKYISWTFLSRKRNWPSFMGLLFSEICFYGYSTNYPGGFQATNHFNNGIEKRTQLWAWRECHLHHLHLCILAPGMYTVGV